MKIDGGTYIFFFFFLRLKEKNQEIILSLVSQKQGCVYLCHIFQLRSHVGESHF